ncbi:MAG: ABC transporter permease [Oscillospiraceae bacterium]
MNKQKPRTLREKLASDQVTTVLASLICIAIGLIIGFFCLLAIDPAHAWSKGFLLILKGGLCDIPYGIGKVLSNAAPLILCGLSVGFAFQTGLFNIGAAGQYTVGAFGALYFAIVLHSPWYICLLAAMVFGAVWGAIPGLFKAYLNINEVITSIMFNWIGLYGVNELIYGGGTGLMYDSKSTKTFTLATGFPDALIPNWGLSDLFQQKSATIAIFIAVILAIVVQVVLNKTTFGYELKACGHNRSAARYAGIDEKRNIILAMVISGALAGIGAGLFYLSGAAEWNPQVSTALPMMGFNGISVALLASSNPIGTVFSALFISHITVGGTYLPTKYFPREISDLISGIIIYLCAFSLLFRVKIKGWLAAKKGEKEEKPV